MPLKRRLRVAGGLRANDRLLLPPLDARRRRQRARLPERFADSTCIASSTLTSARNLKVFGRFEAQQSGRSAASLAIN